MAKKASDLEQAWRSLIPVESFTKEPADPRPTVRKPNVGIRWGKPADFDFTMPEEQGSKRRSGELEITNAPIVYERLEIIGIDEVWRKFKKGTIVDAEEEDFQVEDTIEWMFEGGTSHSFPTTDIWMVEYERSVNVFFKFKMSPQGQVEFVEDMPSYDERGDFPEGQIWKGVEILK